MGAMLRELSHQMEAHMEKQWEEFWIETEKSLRSREGCPPEQLLAVMRKWLRIGYQEGYQDGGLAALHAAEKARDLVTEMRHEDDHAPQERQESEGDQREHLNGDETR
jgi:hypothetical protein